MSHQIKSPFGHCESVAWVTLPDMGGLQLQKTSGFCEQLQSVVTMARSNFTDEETQELEELIRIQGCL
jgi:hypothetical protein